MEDRSWNEATEKFGDMLRWTEQPKDEEQGRKTIYLGPVIQGIYTNLRTGVGKNESNVHEITLPDGRLVGIWGSDLLDGKFKEIPIGFEVNVQYLGIQQPKSAGGRPYNGFKVMYAKPVTQMVEAAPAAAPGGAVAATPAAPAQPQPPTGQPAAPTAGGQGW